MDAVLFATALGPRPATLEGNERARAQGFLAGIAFLGAHPASQGDGEAGLPDARFPADKRPCECTCVGDAEELAQFCFAANHWPCRDRLRFDGSACGTGDPEKLAAGVKAVVLDRGGYQYHGRVRSLAEGAREGGLDL